MDGLYEEVLAPGPESGRVELRTRVAGERCESGRLDARFHGPRSKSDKKVSNQTFVSALYATIAGNDAPTAVGQSYWQGLLTSGESRAQVQQMFQASGGLLPPPTITWATPAAITYGTALGPAQLDATASVPGTFTYVVPRGHDPQGGQSDTDRSPSRPAIRPTIPPSPAPRRSACSQRHRRSPGPPRRRSQQGTALSGTQLDATATCVVGGHTVSVPGTFTYSAPPGTVLPAGSNSVTEVIFTPTDTTDFTTSTASATDHGPGRWRW